MALAYYLSFWVRLEWIDFAQASYENEQGETVYFHPDMVKDGVALPNTHDSFYFGSILQKAHFEMHQDNNLIPSALNSGMINSEKIQNVLKNSKIGFHLFLRLLI